MASDGPLTDEKATATDDGAIATDDGARATEGGARDGAACPCRHKETPRDEELQADLQKRLNRVIGQLGGVKAMLDDNRYCADVLTQLAAAESAVHSISAVVLRNHLETCVVEQIERGNVEIIDEVMNLLKKFSR